MTYNASRSYYSHMNNQELSMDLQTHNYYIQMDFRVQPNRGENAVHTQGTEDPGPNPMDESSLIVCLRDQMDSLESIFYYYGPSWDF